MWGNYQGIVLLGLSPVHYPSLLVGQQSVRHTVCCPHCVLAGLVCLLRRTALTAITHGAEGMTDLSPVLLAAEQLARSLGKSSHVLPSKAAMLRPKSFAELPVAVLQPIRHLLPIKQAVPE